MSPSAVTRGPETGFEEINGALLEANIFPVSSLGLTPLFPSIRHEQIQGRYRQSVRLRLVPKATPCFTRPFMVEFVDNHREIISA